MMNNINKPKNVPNPSSAVVQKAMDLVAAFGSDNKALKAGLSEMLSVQKFNEDLLKANRAEYLKISEAAKTLEANRNEFTQYKYDENSRLNRERTDLKKEKDAFYHIRENAKRSQDDAQLVLADRESNVAEREQDVESNLKKLQEGMQEYRQLKSKVDAAGSIVKDRRDKLNCILSDIKARLSGV